MTRTITEDDPSHPSSTNHLIGTDGRKVDRILFTTSPLSEKARVELKLACETSPVEVCGLITEQMEIHYIANVHEFPRENFYMDHAEFTETVRQIMEGKKDKILGVFHTHPTGIVWPSPRDIVGWPNPDLGWRYFIVTARDVIEWALVTP